MANNKEYYEFAKESLQHFEATAGWERFIKEIDLHIATQQQIVDNYKNKSHLELTTALAKLEMIKDIQLIFHKIRKEIP